MSLSSASPPTANEEESSSATSTVFNEICMACRIGDYEVVDSLLSTPNLDINQVDEYDYSPLILSSLCGHYKIVELLLQRGAVCDRDTFQGARCIYGALTEEIRDLLISFDISKAVDISQPFASHISSLLNPLVSNYQDLIIQIGNENLSLHRFLLSARSDYFKSKLESEWEELTVVKLNEAEINPVVFKGIINYIYLKSDSIGIDDESIQDDLLNLAIKYQLYDLVEAIRQVKSNKSESISKLKHDLSFKFLEKARSDLNYFLTNSIIHGSINSEMNLNDEIEFEDIEVERYLSEKRKSILLSSKSIPDLILATIDISSESVVYYPVNKSIISRSEYFDTMFKSNIFKFSQEEDLPTYQHDTKLQVINRPQLLVDNLPVIQLSLNTSNIEISELILTYLYHDDISNIPLKLTIDLLFAAEELLLERLKTMCAVNISSKFNKFTFEELEKLQDNLDHDVFDLIRVSWEARCEKLEQHITKFLAYNLKSIFDNTNYRDAFSKLIKESAERIKERQDTDTIELIDDIRYYLTKKYAINEDTESFDPLNFSSDDKKDNIKLYNNALAKYESDIEIIDYLLQDLQLDA
ncbi:unnamed protein product [Candida verbasci]|uniref:BTB domain-containing protein n=1 Tax=Candida verbasci TaxID=1227364 RepID=A0A9W4XF85_9ASCO|nr:unnamed protein product [Candida verbasci]